MPPTRFAAPRPRRRATFGVLAAAASSLTLAAPAFALTPATLATPATTTMPGTSRVVDDWKLVGRAPASAVQIAPRWVISADHASVPEGSVFRNGYGAATVLKQYRPTYGASPGFQSDADDPSGTDLTLELLDAPIPAPSFPKLLAQDLSESMSAGLPGLVLLSGYGDAPADQPLPTVGWMNPNGTGIGGVGVDPPLLAGNDSGGPFFWYPSASSAPVIAELMGGGLFPRFGAQIPLGGYNPTYGEDLRSFMAAAFAANPAATPPTFTGLHEVLPAVTGARPASVQGLKLATPGASTVKLSWTNPPAGGVPRTGFKVVVGERTVQTLGAAASSVTLRGLAWQTRYVVRVVPTSAVGDAYLTGAGADTVTFKTRWLF